MQEDIENSRCGCPVSKSPSKSTKYYHEIEAEVIGNKLLIRVEKNRNKQKKHASEWDPTCNCGSIPEIIRPTRTQDPRIVNIDDNNQIIFRINSKSQIKCEGPNYRPEIVNCQLGDNTHSDQERALMVYQQLEGGGSHEIYQNHITVGNQTIFMMRIKKKSDSKEKQNRNIELEVTYPNLPPRIPTPPPPPPLTEPAKNISKSVDVYPKKLDKSKKAKKGKKKKKNEKEQKVGK